MSKFELWYKTPSGEERESAFTALVTTNEYTLTDLENVIKKYDQKHGTNTYFVKEIVESE